jgi:hypothetical protein
MNNEFIFLAKISILEQRTHHEDLIGWRGNVKHVDCTITAPEKFSFIGCPNIIINYEQI